jgi:tRNA (5-methylaminomethyl-2-thiouridylate)-methyltransferase
MSRISYLYLLLIIGLASPFNGVVHALVAVKKDTMADHTMTEKNNMPSVVQQLSSYEKIATGHYAQVLYKDGYYRLLRSPDPVKDQSYFLSHLNQLQLSRLLFPIGHLEKSQVRILAQEYDLPNKDRKDSQGICFLGKLKFRDFIKHYVGEKSGNMIEVETGAVVGHHTGYWFYTIGQRQGIGLSGGPWYVVAKDTQRNIVSISRNYYDADKHRNSLMIEDCNWIGEVPCKIDYLVKVRHGAHMYRATVRMQNNNTAHIVLSEHDQGIAPGQFAVIYDDMECLGSGIIKESQ